MHILLLIFLLASATSITPSKSAHNHNRHRTKVGDQVGKWRLGTSLGGGLTNEAYYAEKAKKRWLPFLAKQDAVIKLAPSQPWYKTSETAMQHEARMLKKASQYPAVAKFIRYIPLTLNGEEGIVMEHVKGMNLHEEVRQNGLFTEDQVRRLFLPLIQTLSAMYTKLGLIHRDIKPRNVMVDSKRTFLKLIDFELSVMLNSQLPEDKGFDPTKSLCGTKGFIAPEIASGDISIKNLPKSDVFSVTVTMFDALFAGVQIDTWSNKINYVVPPGATSSPELNDLINQGMTVDVNKRPSMQELANHPFFKGGSPPRKASNAISNAISKVSSFGRKVFARKKPSN